LPKNKEGSKSSAPQVYAEESGSFVAWNATFDSNQAGYGDVPTSWGGVAALLDGSTFAAHDSSFTSNYAGDAGGVFDVETSSALELTSSTVEANSCGDVRLDSAFVVRSLDRSPAAESPVSLRRYVRT